MDSMAEVRPAATRTRCIGAFFDESSLGFFFANPEGLIEYLNAEAAGIIGFDSVDEACGQSLQDIESVLSCGLADAHRAALKGRTFRRDEHRCTNRKGHFAVLSLFCSPYRGEEGEVNGLLGIIQDVSEPYWRKSDLEKAICELSIMAEVSDALSSTVELGKVIQIILTGVTANQGLGFNRAFLFLIDESANVLEGKIAVGPSGPEEAGQIWSQLALQQESLADLLSDYVERRGTNASPLSSLIDGWRISLSEPSIFSRVLHDACGANVCAGDLDEPSRGILRRLQTENLAVAPIISKDKRLGLIAADNQITGKAIRDTDVQLLQTFANHTAVAIERSRLHDDLVRHAATLEERNRQIAESQEQMIQIEKMSVIGEVTSSIAHELRNPLTVIGGFANLMLTADADQHNGEYLNIIVSEAKRAESVLHQVLDFSRASRTESRELDFRLLVNNTYELLLSKLRHSQKPPVLNQSDRKMLVWGNPDQLRHALYQFMALSVEEMTGECMVEFVTLAENDKVLLRIRFIGADNARKKVTATLNQFFGSSTGTQKLSIIVAGETIRYHGGSFGIEGAAGNMPAIYVELPCRSGGDDA
jgi:PAS domain S-box-containing protein